MSKLLKFLAPLLKWQVHKHAKKSLPKIQGNLQLSGIKDTIEILRDKWGVPHIYAQTQEDVSFGQGYVHAQDRLWQMELNRCVASGTACELLGEDLLQVDRIMRTLGFARMAAMEEEKLKGKPVYDLLAAYVRGVNACIEGYGKKLPFEFKLLGCRPAPFTIQDVITIGKMMGFQMSYGWLIEIDRQRIVDLVGPEKAAELDIYYHHENPVVLPKGNETYQIKDDGRLDAFNGPFLKPLGGSNNWAVTPSKSDTGNAQVCNDPHLPLTLPGIWYENHLIAPDLEVTGVSAPGLPAVLVGHNADIAWGVTLAFTDIQDTYIEEFTDDSCTQYHYKGEMHESQIIEEEIKIKGRKKPHIERVVATHHGPIISDLVGYPNKKLSLCSKALQINQGFEGFYEINIAKNWNDFTAAVKKIAAPALNIVYGDIQGNIGYWMTGQVPRRNKHDEGTLPRQGSSGLSEWEGNLPFEEMPHAFNPERGVVFTCNHKIVNEDYPHYLGDYWMNGFRAASLDRMFSAKEKFDKQDFAEMHLSFDCIPGREMAQRYATLHSSKDKVQEAIDLFKNWDGQLTADSVGGCIYQVLKKKLTDRVIGQPLNNQLANRFRGMSSAEFALPLSEYFGHDITALLRILDTPKSWWNQQAGGTETILLQGMEAAVIWLTQKLGKDSTQWKWGSLHQLTFSHPFGRKAPFDKILNIGPFPVGGDGDTPNQVSFIPEKPYDGGGLLIGASFRQIVDLGDFNKSLSLLPPGQSGNPMSPHYADQAQKWIAGTYKPMYWDRKEIEANLTGVLRLLASD